jgi:CheY-like chemotaxis protein
MQLSDGFSHFPSMGVSYFGAGRLVLVVDDQQDFCIATEQLLIALGFKVACAANGLEALRILRKKPVSIILTDLFMPEMDGVELIKLLANNPSKPVPPIIAVTGDHIAAESVGAAAATLGAHAVLMKPFTVEQLASAISFAVSQAKKLMRGAV